MSKFYCNIGLALCDLVISAFGALVLINGFRNSSYGIYGAAIIALVWIIICYNIFAAIAVRSFSRKSRFLLNNCRIRDYTARYEKLLAKSRNRKARNKTILNLITGYHLLGDRDKEKQALSQIDPVLGTEPLKAKAAPFYYDGLAAFYLSTGDVEQAKQAISSLRSKLGSSNANNSRRPSFSQQLEEKEIILNMLENNYDGAKECFTSLLSKKTSPLRKVYAHYYLANICLHFNKTEEAVEHLLFVIGNGGDTYYVAKAKEFIKNKDK